MKLTSRSFEHEQPIPHTFAFCRPDPETHATFADNRNPHLAFHDVPADTRSLVLLCIDTEAPTVGDDVNQEGRTVAHDLPRADFVHWVLVDVPPDCPGLDEGACSDGVTPGGQRTPDGPAGSRQGLNDYTSWFAGDAEMGGPYHGYDGPAPPWNDERVHRYAFRLYATDLERCPVEGSFTAADVTAAIDGHVLAEAELVGTYTLNRALDA